VRKAFETRSAVEKKDAKQILIEEWNKEIEKDHIHYNIYFSLAEKYITDFASIFSPEKERVEFIDLVFGEGGEQQVQLDLVSAYKVGQTIKATLFRPESLKDELNNKGLLLWGKIKPKHRTSLVLLKERFGNLKAFVFSGDDGILYEFQWSDSYYEKQKHSVSQKCKELSSEKFITDINSFKCNNFCEHRLSCPYWVGVSV